MTQAIAVATAVGNGPAFSAYANTPQSVTSNTATLVNFGTEEYDTASCYNNATGRFTPNVAGYYQVNAAMNANSTWTREIINIYKNGSNYKTCCDINASANTIEGNAMVYCNGTTDYIEIYAYITGTSPQIYGGASAANAAYTYFQACLIRGA